jgi:hypothetical protein
MKILEQHLRLPARKHDIFRGIIGVDTRNVHGGVDDCLCVPSFPVPVIKPCCQVIEVPRGLVSVVKKKTTTPHIVSI